MRHAQWCFDGAGIALDGLAAPRIAIGNAATALQAVRLLVPDAVLDRERIDMASRMAELSGRFQTLQVRGRSFVLDVAHNPHAAAFLADQLRDRPATGRTVAVAGILRDKDAIGIVDALASGVDQWWFADTLGERGQPASNIVKGLTTRCRCELAPALDTAMSQAIAATGPNDRILVAGSFDIVQRAAQWLHAAERAA